MPKIIKDSEGNDVEVITSEEVEAAKKTAVSSKEKEFAEKEQELATLRSQDRNFRAVNEAKDKAEKEYAELKAAGEKEKTERDEKEISDYRESMFSALAGKDEELKKKAKNLLKKIQNILWGEEKIKIIIEDRTGNSAIISDKAVKEKLK